MKDPSNKSRFFSNCIINRLLGPLDLTVKKMLKMRDKLTNQLMMTAIMAQLLSTVLARGPHHPRGEKIAHHHVHYRPTRGISPESHVPVPKITQDKELIHDKE